MLITEKSYLQQLEDQYSAIKITSSKTPVPNFHWKPGEHLHKIRIQSYLSCQIYHSCSVTTVSPETCPSQPFYFDWWVMEMRETIPWVSPPEHWPINWDIKMVDSKTCRISFSQGTNFPVRVIDIKNIDLVLSDDY